MIYILTWLLLLIPYTAHATDKLINGTMPCFKIGIFDTDGNGVSGLTWSDITLYMQCGRNTLVTVNETGDTIVEDSDAGGYYDICTNDSITSTNEDECSAWVTGTGIAKSPVKIKDIGATMDAVKVASASCDITAATSGTSFTVGTCIDVNGNSITLATDKWVGSGMIAYTNGAAACNVEGEYIMVGAMTSGGVVTARTSDVPNSGFKATPSITNCGVKLTP